MSTCDEKPEEGCEACNFPTEELTFYEYGAGFKKGEGHWICNVCAETISGNMNRYPNQYSYDHIQTIKMIAYCTNMIMAKIQK